MPSELNIRIIAHPEAGDLQVKCDADQTPIWVASFCGFELPNEAVGDALRTAIVKWLEKNWGPEVGQHETPHHHRNY